MSAGYLVEPKAASERVALVTAGSAGLGAQIVRTLAPDFRVVSLQLS
jgi:NAD(P)-dependent dehydrogenase (short-subunit alcohol dehydrogenase family)